MLTVTLRPANNADAPAIQELVHRVLREYGLEPDPERFDADLVDIEGFYLARGGVFVVLEDDTGTILGTAGLLPKGEGAFELRKMYFDPSLRGQGWGKALLHRMLETARTCGARRVTLETAGVLVEAIGLYQSFGFQPMEGIEVPRCDRAFVLELADYRVPDAAIAERARFGRY